MDINKIMKLVDAGFSKDEIMKMIPHEQTQEQTQKQEQTQEQTENKEQETTMADVLKAVAKLTSVVQANAIQNSVMPKQHTQEDAESMIAEIIRPTFKERG